MVSLLSCLAYLNHPSLEKLEKFYLSLKTHFQCHFLCDAFLIFTGQNYYYFFFYSVVTALYYNVYELAISKIYRHTLGPPQ